MGSPTLAAWIAQIVFWTLVVYGRAMAVLTVWRAAIYIALWVAGLVGLPYLPYAPAPAMFPSFVAVLDIALVFTIFKGDARLT
jgi:hypothetical protein